MLKKIKLNCMYAKQVCPAIIDAKIEASLYWENIFY
jgi:hypothetical protein